MNLEISILVVDDDPDILTIIRDNLKLDGYGVLTASNGRLALEQFQRNPVDLVVLDLMLPDMDGIQVCRAIRQHSHVPIIMLTAKDGVSDKVLGLESGADDYLVKPFDYLELAARIKARLRRRNSLVSAAEVLRLGGIQIDVAARQVTVDAHPVALTPKEFDILHLLASRAGQVLSRESIREVLWPEAQLYRWSRTIDVHIKNLRSKLGDNPEDPQYIRTVSGVGYMMPTAGGPVPSL
ncbi:MAG: response regulator transcription factor [Desulfobacterales bacterium]